MKRTLSILFLLSLPLVAGMALSAEGAEKRGRDRIPVHGPARVAVEDWDLLRDTVLELGVLAVTPTEKEVVYVGDGITPGGIPIHPRGCVTNFAQIANATTNLNMYSYSITFGPWRMHGDANELDILYGVAEPWLRFIRDSGDAYLKYDFEILGGDAYRFTFAWSDTNAVPVLQVATNLLEDFEAADPADTVYTWLDATTLQVSYTNPASFIFFRVFAASRLDSGAYFSVPVNAGAGVVIPEGQGIEMGGAPAVTNWGMLNQWFIPKWPSWYQFGTSGALTPPDSIGLFSALGLIYLQNVDKGISIVAKGNDPMSITPGADIAVNSVSGSVRIAAGMPVNQMPLRSKGLILGSTNGVVIDAPSVTWNGASKNGWDDITAGVASGVSSNAEEIAQIKEDYLPKWPVWYKFGNADTNETPDIMSSTGLFATLLGNFLQFSHNLNIGTIGDWSSFYQSYPTTSVFSRNGRVALSAGRSITLTSTDAIITSTNASSGLTLTNSANGDFTVTWNGVTRSGWTDTSGLVAKTNGDWVISQTNGFSVQNGDWRPINVYTNPNGSKHATFGYGARTAAFGFDAEVVDIGTDADSVSVGNAALKLDIGKDLNSTNFHIYKNPKFPDGLTATSISADSISLGTNDVGEAVASVERRIDRLEGSVCAIFWGTNYMSQSDTTYYIPTNFPTAKLLVVLTDNIVTNVTVTTPKDWNPGRDVEIEILPISNSTRIGNRSIRFTIADSSSEGQTLTSTTTYRKYFYTYFRDGDYWQFWCDSGGQFPWQFTTAGGRTSTLSTWRGPETVEDWLALHPEWASP